MSSKLAFYIELMNMIQYVLINYTNFVWITLQICLTLNKIPLKNYGGCHTVRLIDHINFKLPLGVLKKFQLWILSISKYKMNIFQA
jgi:hypothetical protein